MESGSALGDGLPAQDDGVRQMTVRVSCATELAGLPEKAGIATADVDRSIPECFGQQVALHRARKAIACGKWQPTYERLNAAANHLAHALLARGGTSGDRVAVLMRHDGPLVAALLAVWKGGRIAVVCNPGDSPAHLEQVLGDAQPTLLLADGRNRARAGKVAAKNCPVICVDDYFSEEPAPDPVVAIGPDDPATLIYPAGSAGHPLGILGTHRAFLHQVFRGSRGMELSPGDRLPLLSPLSDSLGLEAVGCALLNGAALCPFPLMEKGVAGLESWMVKHRINVYFSSVFVFQHFMSSLPDDHRFPGFRLVRIGSDAFTAADFAAHRRRFPDDCILMQTFGSAETGSVWQTRWRNGDGPPAGPLAAACPAEGVEVPLLGGDGNEIAVRSRSVPSHSPARVRPRTLMEKRIAGIWEDVLRCPPPGVYDTFLELGGDSLLALGLVLRLTRELGGNEKDWLALLLRVPTIAQMAEAAGNLNLVRAKRAPWFQFVNAALIPMRESGDANPIVFIPGGYTSENELLVCAGLLPHLNAARPVYGVRLNLWAGRVLPPLSVSGLARKIDRALHESGRFEDAPVLVGECAASSLAFETAKVLQRRHGKPPRLILLDPFLPRTPSPVGRVRAPEPMAVRRYLRLLQAYRPSAFQGGADLVCCEESGRAEICLAWWRQFLPGGCQVHVVPGDHDTYIRRHQKPLAETLDAICESPG